MNITPLEKDEQIIFVQWLNIVGIKHTSIPNSTYTKSWNQKRQNQQMGLNKGFPDMVIFINANQSIVGHSIMLFVELKRLKGGSIKPEQKEWVESINTVPNIEAKICKGSKEAIEFVCKYLDINIQKYCTN